MCEVQSVKLPIGHRFTKESSASLEERAQTTTAKYFTAATVHNNQEIVINGLMFPVLNVLKEAGMLRGSCPPLLCRRGFLKTTAFNCYYFFSTYVKGTVKNTSLGFGTNASKT